MSLWFLLEVLCLLLMTGLVSFAVIRRRLTPLEVVFWALLTAVQPVISFIVWLFLGQPYYRRQTFVRPGDAPFLPPTAPAARAALGPAGALISTRIEETGGSVLTDDNTVRHFTNPLYFEALFDAFAGAQRTIVAQWFTVEGDEVGGRFLGLLTERARAGVEVYLLMDGLSAVRITGELRALRRAGGHTAVFNSLLRTALSPRKNDRDHRKIAVIDGTVAFTGGFNVAERYVGRSSFFGNWRDAGARIEGSAADRFTLEVLRHWRFATGRDLVSEPRFYGRQTGPGQTAVQVTTGGPDCPDRNSILEQYLAVAEASRTSLYLTSPFFVPSAALQAALIRRAEAGTDVKIIIARLPVIGLVGRYYAGRLIGHGVRVYEYDGGFIHAKTMVGDRCWGCVGSANHDARSAAINFECNAMVYDPAFGTAMAEAFEHDLTECTEYTVAVHRSRSVFAKIKTAAALLLSREM